MNIPRISLGQTPMWLFSTWVNSGTSFTSSPVPMGLGQTLIRWTVRHSNYTYDLRLQRIVRETSFKLEQIGRAVSRQPRTKPASPAKAFGNFNHGAKKLLIALVAVSLRRFVWSEQFRRESFHRAKGDFLADSQLIQKLLQT